MSVNTGFDALPDPGRVSPMAPLVERFHPARLEEHVRYKPNGKIRKPPVDLKQCELKELIQYHCNLEGPKHDKRSKVVCEPVLRLFRKYVEPGYRICSSDPCHGECTLICMFRCADGLMVETTSWEDVHD